MTIRVAQFLDVASGLQPKQFSVGGHVEIDSLDDLDPMYKQLLDRPIACVLAVMGRRRATEPDPHVVRLRGRQRCSSTWRPTVRKYGWIRKDPHLTLVLVNPDNAYHWVSIRCTRQRGAVRGRPGRG